MCRKLQVTSLYQTSSSIDAQKIVRTIRSLAVQGAKTRSRSIVVVINPHSGPGRSLTSATLLQ